MISDRSWQAALAGMQQAARAANPDWVRYVSMLIIEVARKQEYFYTDDIERLRQLRGGPTTHNLRAIGGLMRAAAKAGIMSRTIRLMPGRWDKKVWRSNVYRR